MKSIKISVAELKTVIKEAVGAVKLLDTVECRIKLSDELNIEEILTEVRVIKGVATVNQLTELIRLNDGTRVLPLLISFDPKDMDKLSYVNAMAEEIRKIPSVVLVVVRSLNGSAVRDKLGRALVY